jgi:hypothetical protein
VCFQDSFWRDKSGVAAKEVEMAELSKRSHPFDASAKGVPVGYKHDWKYDDAVWMERMQGEETKLLCRGLRWTEWKVSFLVFESEGVVAVVAALYPLQFLDETDNFLEEKKTYHIFFVKFPIRVSWAAFNCAPASVV